MQMQLKSAVGIFHVLAAPSDAPNNAVPLSAVTGRVQSCANGHNTDVTSPAFSFHFTAGCQFNLISATIGTVAFAKTDEFNTLAVGGHGVFHGANGSDALVTISGQLPQDPSFSVEMISPGGDVDGTVLTNVQLSIQGGTPPPVTLTSAEIDTTAASAAFSFHCAQAMTGTTVANSACGDTLVSYQIATGAPPSADTSSGRLAAINALLPGTQALAAGNTSLVSGGFKVTQTFDSALLTGGKILVVLSNSAKTGVTYATVSFTPPTITTPPPTTGGNTGGTNSSTTGTATPSSVPFGFNVNSVHDWDRDYKWVNLFMQNRGFKKPGGAPAALGANGYPTEDFDVFLLTGYVGAAAIYNGTYKLKFHGSATVSVGGATGAYGSISNVHYDATTGYTTADFTLNASNADGSWYLVLSFRNVQNLGDMRLIIPGYPVDTTEVFTTVFKNAIADSGTIRTMDLAGTNIPRDATAEANALSAWNQRTLPTDAQQCSDDYTKGLAWEYIIRLANETHQDLWVNVPVKATDDYVTHLAQLLKSSLDSSRAFYVEFSNELWNGQFGQRDINVAAALAEKDGTGTTSGVSLVMEGGETDNTLHLRRQARRTVEISNIFRTVFGDAAMNSRVRVVLGGQFDVPYNLNDQLNLVRAKFPQAPNYYLYGLAVAPYYFLPAQQSSSALVLSTMQTAIDGLNANMPPLRTVASVAGLHLLAYEGGPDMTRSADVTYTNDASLNQDGMRQLTINFLTGWYAHGGELINYFTGGASAYNTNYTQWGVTNFITQLDTPKMRGIRAVRAATYPTLTGGSVVPGDVPALSYTDYTGNANGPTYVWNKDEGSAIDFLLRTSASGTYKLQLNYAVNDPGAQFEITVNGGASQLVSLPVTGSGHDANWAWTDFKNLPAPVSLTLNAGFNGLRIHWKCSNHQKPSLKTLSFTQ